MRASFLTWIFLVLAITAFTISAVDSGIADLNRRIAREISERIGDIKVWFLNDRSELPDLLRILSSGEIDALVGLWRMDSKEFIFSDYPVYAVKHVLIHRVEKKHIESIGILRNTDAEALVRKLGNFKYVVYDGSSKMVEDLVGGKLDAVLIDSIRAETIMRSVGGLEYKTVYGKSYRFIVLSPKTDRKILNRIDSTLKDMYREDVFKEIIDELDLEGVVMPPDSLVFVNSEWPPYEYLEDGEWKGTDVEVLRTVLGRLGYELEIRVCPWLRCLEMVKLGEVDGTFTLERTEEREKYMIFSDEPISYGSDVLFHMKDSNVDPTNPGRYRCGYVAGYAYRRYLENSGFKLIRVQDDETGMRLLSMGRLDLFMANLRVGIYYAKKLGILDRISWTKPLRMYPSYVAFSRVLHHRALAVDFSKELRAFKREGGYLKLLKKYDLLEIRGVGR